MMLHHCNRCRSFGHLYFFIAFFKIRLRFPGLVVFVFFNILIFIFFCFVVCVGNCFLHLYFISNVASNVPYQFNFLIFYAARAQSRRPVCHPDKKCRAKGTHYFLGTYYCLALSFSGLLPLVNLCFWS